MNKWIKILFGLILLNAVILFGYVSLSWGRYDFGRPAFILLKGGLMWMVAFIAVFLIILGILELKE
jgi:hypothetical protein